MKIKRPLVGMAAALVLGEVIAKAGVSISVVVWICSTLFCCVLCSTQIQKRRMIMMLPACMGIGMILALQASKILPLDAFVQQDSIICSVQGTVYWKESSGEKWKIYIKETEVLVEQRVYECENLLLYVKSNEEVLIGDKILAEGEITSFSQATNPGQFNAKQYYSAKKIQYAVYVSGDIVVTQKNAKIKNIVKQWLMEIRLSLLASLEEICLSNEFGMFQAVFLGEKSSIDVETKALYQRNGIAHILAISGLHISFIGNVLYELLRKITGSYKWSMVGGIILLAAYGWMTGLAVSAFRAVIMFFIMMGAKTVGRSYDMLSAAGLSAIMVLIQYPSQLYEAGFLLTYGAIIGIGGIMPCLQEILALKGKFGKALLCSFSVQATTLPIILWFYYTYPIYSIVLNLFVIPFAGYLLFSALAGSIVAMWWRKGGMFFIGSGHFVLQYYDMLCNMVQKLPFTKDVVGRPALWQVILYYGIWLWVLFLGKRYSRKEEQQNSRLQQKREIKKVKNIIGVVILSLFLYGILRPIGNGLLVITILDVDQGDCICIQMPDGSNMLIDGGSTGIDQVGTYRILPYLLSQGIGTLEQIVITHPDADHMNGICEILEEGTIDVKQLYIPDLGEQETEFSELFALAAEKHIPIVYGKKGDQWGNEILNWMCLYPEKGYRGSDMNSYSLVLRLAYGNFSALFMGDAGIEQEKQLENIEDITFLKVGHHGSNYSSGQFFLEKANPLVSAISCGIDNFYGHPHKEVLNRLEAVGSQMIITKDSGAITVKTDGKQFWIDTYQ